MPSTPRSHAHLWDTITLALPISILGAPAGLRGHTKLEAAPQPSHWESGRAHPHGWVWLSGREGGQEQRTQVYLDSQATYGCWLKGNHRPAIAEEARAGAIIKIRTKDETEHTPQGNGHRSQIMSTSHYQCKRCGELNAGLHLVLSRSNLRKLCGGDSTQEIIHINI